MSVSPQAIIRQISVITICKMTSKAAIKVTARVVKLAPKELMMMLKVTKVLVNLREIFKKRRLNQNNREMVVRITCVQVLLIS